jgi:hypothetical protein
MTDSEQEQVKAMSSEALQILAALESNRNPHEIDRNINRAREILLFANTIPIVQEPNFFREQLNLISTLQSVAYHDPDSGGVRDIAEWCVQRWLRLLQHYPDSWEIFKGRHIPAFAPSYVLLEYLRTC